ncbi:amino acid ABC transporter permease [Candidatus Bipolaricaulota bacterium]|nr:amino acid ABC transporter permease [Candidatus Bipolaricaulota bacterium]
MEIFRVLTGEAPYLLKGILVTIQLLVGLLSLGLVGGVLLAVAEVYGGRVSSTLAILIQRGLRAIPALVLLFLSYYAINLPPLLISIIALGMRSSAYQSQIFRGAIQSIKSGQLMAARSMGMSRLQGIWYVVLPQAVRRAIGPWSNEYASETKDTSLAYVVGVVEIMRRSRYIISYTYGNALLIYGIIALVYFFLTRAGNALLYWLEDKLWVPGFERRS